jgi:uncharacterized protein YcbK (DUF882 family)
MAIYKKFASNPYFKEREMVCKCPRCSRAFIDDVLMDKLTVARDISGVPFIITSGCRCPGHNRAVGGANNSDHLADGGKFICFGVDIHCNSDINRFKVLKALFEVGIERIGLSPTFIHAALGKRNTKNVIWFYGR